MTSPVSTSKSLENSATVVATVTTSAKTLSSKARNLSLVASLVSVMTIALLAFGLFVASTVSTQTMALVFAMLSSVVLLGLSIAALLASQRARSLLVEKKSQS
ncbi:hypothetical protein [Chlamydiifrater volucris]|uniref:hypothetical protein n=1 Tax=Chlamydiifrater volucris TaxID=2681470 RepID=UPI001BCAFC63|nr:hypothetical protein [Chlamydiifrater volucris]